MKRFALILASMAVFFACKPEEPNTNNPNTPPDKPVDKTVHVTGISLNPTSITIYEEDTADIVATVTPDNADNKTVSWTSSNSQVATVADGKVTGIKDGTATISATTEDGGKTATCEVTVLKNLVPAVTVGSRNVSAISAVLQGKANLKSTAAQDLTVGFQYSKSAGFTSTNTTRIDANDVDADYNFNATITGLQPATKYYFRSVVHQNGQDSFGEIIELSTKDLSTLLKTNIVVAIGATCGDLFADIDLTDVVYETISYGFYWGDTQGSQPNFIEGGTIYQNQYKATLNDLLHQTPYWYKAYLKLDDQSFYGELKSFTTGSIPVSSISLDKTYYSFNTIGASITLNATVYPSDATNKAFEWSSSNKDVATVDSSGNVTAKGNGNCDIIVTTLDQGKTAKCRIEVAQLLTSLSLDETSITLAEGKTRTLTASVQPSNAANKTVYWRSTNTAIATVSQSGVVTAVSKGTANIVAETIDGSHLSATCAVTVKRPVSSIQLNKTSLIVYQDNSSVIITEALTATVSPSTADNTAVSWSSSKTSVATVTNNGLVTCKSIGKAIITVTAQDGYGATATCEIDVRQPVNIITFDKKKLDMIIGESRSLSVVNILPQTAYDKSYTWSTTNSSVATVSSSGTVTAKATGTATIKVTANDRGTVSASCTVTVAPKPTAVDMGTVVNGKNVKWANFNIGASDQYGYGYYFAWGETETKDNYIWAYYKFGTSSALTKYNDNSAWGTVDNKTVLDSQDDVARVRLGGNWRIPTEEEWNALKSKCTWSWKVLNGVYGQQVTASNGNKIFLPAAGFITGTTLDLDASYGYYWTTSIGKTNSRYGLAFFFLSSNWLTTDGIRSYGYTVRAVTE